MNNEYQINLMSNDFYNNYPPSLYPEIETKQTRPFLVLIIKIEGNTFAIPFRSNIRHNFCYKFKNSRRKTGTKTALDFTKAVIISDLKYIGVPAKIDHYEYVELSSKSTFIINKFRSFLKKYKRVIHNPTKYQHDYNVLSKYCTLKYFTDFLK